MDAKVKDVLQKIIDTFTLGEIPEAVEVASFPIPNIPSTDWSFTNRLIMYLSETADARGFKQWKKAERSVKKGSKAIYIISPRVRKEANKKTGKEETTLYGFKATPVFRVEDTDGAEIFYDDLVLPELPFMDRAREWGINIKAIPGNLIYRGYFSPHKQEIGLATTEEKTFFHELAHAAEHRLVGKLKKRQDPLQEITAELVAQALCRMVGKRDKDTTGNSYQYIERYAEKINKPVHSAVLSVLQRAAQIIDLIMKGDRGEV